MSVQNLDVPKLCQRGRRFEIILRWGTQNLWGCAESVPPESWRRSRKYVSRTPPPPVFIIIISSSSSSCTALSGPWPPQANVAIEFYLGQPSTSPASLSLPPPCQFILISVSHVPVELQGLCISFSVMLVIWPAHLNLPDFITLIPPPRLLFPVGRQPAMLSVEEHLFYERVFFGSYKIVSFLIFTDFLPSKTAYPWVRTWGMPRLKSTSAPYWQKQGITYICHVNK